MTKGKMIAIEEGISRCAISGRIKARFEYGGKGHSKWFSAHVDLAVVRAWRTTKRASLVDGRAADGVPPVTRGAPITAGRTLLSAEIERFVPQLTGRPAAAADASHLRAWLAVVVTLPDGKGGEMRVRFADLSLDQLTTELVNLAIAQWRSKPSRHAVRRIHVAPYTRHGIELPGYERAAPLTSGAVVAKRTVRHRCRMLTECIHGLYGESAQTPCTGAKVPSVPKPLPKGIPKTILLEVAKELARRSIPHPPVSTRRDTPAYWIREHARTKDYERTYARHVVLITTGQRPVQLMIAVPDDLDLAAKTWIVRAAKEEPAHTITLTEDMIRAWRAFLAADAWGWYDVSTHANRLHACGLPHGMRPYNARHEVMIDALARGVDLGDVQGLAGHTSPETTRKFYAPVVIARQREVSNKLEGRLADLFEPRLLTGTKDE